MKGDCAFEVNVTCHPTFKIIQVQWNSVSTYPEGNEKEYVLNKGRIPFVQYSYSGL